MVSIGDSVTTPRGVGIVVDGPEIFGGQRRFVVERAHPDNAYQTVRNQEVEANLGDGPSFPEFALGEYIHICGKLAKLVRWDSPNGKWVVHFIVSHGSPTAGKVSRQARSAFTDTHLKLIRPQKAQGQTNGKAA